MLLQARSLDHLLLAMPTVHATAQLAMEALPNVTAWDKIYDHGPRGVTWKGVSSTKVEWYLCERDVATQGNLLFGAHNTDVEYANPSLHPIRERMVEYESLCRSHGHPAFICPSGKCFSCGYDHTKGGTVRPAYTTTGCPSCHRSYCD